MQLFYTTTTGYEDFQPNSSRSLGGYRSSTPVVNDDFGNLFDDISILTMKNARDEYRALILKNVFTTQTREVTLKVEVPSSSFCTYKVAVVPLKVVDKYNNRAMDNIQSPYSKPFVQFIDLTPDTVVNMIKTMNPGDEVGIWICRHIDKNVAKAQYETVCMPDPNDPTGRRYIPIEKETEETVDFSIDWRG